MMTRQQFQTVNTAVWTNRLFSFTVFALVIIACFAYLLWEPLSEHVLAWMRWHFWGYPA